MSRVNINTQNMLQLKDIPSSFGSVFLSLCISISLCLSGGFWVPAQGAEVRLLTLDQALEIGLANNRDIQKSREYFRLVDGRYVTERAAALPQITVNGAISRERDESQRAFIATSPVNVDRRSAEVNLTQALFTWGQVGAAIRAAKVGLKTADDQLRLNRQATQRDVTAAFYDILLARALSALAAQNLEQKSRHLDEASRKQTAGVATDYDVLAARVAVENARPEVIRSGNQVQTTREQLRFLLAMETEEVDASGTLETVIGPVPEYAQALAVAKERRPELNDLRHRLGIAEELVIIANAGDKPRLDLKGGYGWRQLEVSGTSSDGPAWNVGLYLTFPIFDGLRSRGKVAQAESDLRSQQLDEAKQVDAVALQTRNAVNAVHEAEEIVKALAGNVTQAERLLSMAEKGYELGVKIRLEVDDAELNLLQAKGNLARARRDYLVARVDLEWAMGVLGEGYQQPEQVALNKP